MGRYYRSLSNRTCWLRHRTDIQELFREQGVSLVPKGKIPDPWDDYPRKDHKDRSWKRHRKTQYRVKLSHVKVPRPKVKYNSDWCYCGRHWFSQSIYEPQKSYYDLVWHFYKKYRRYGKASSLAKIMEYLGVNKIYQFRVRSSYRKHKYAK